MVLHVLRILEKTSAELPGIIMTEYSTDNGYGNRNMILDFIHQLYNVFVLIYNQRNRELMRPLRMMMAQIIGRILLWLVTWQEFRLMASMPLWKNWLQKLAQDQYEYRQTLAQRGAANSLVPDEAAIEVLLNNDELREMFGEIVI